MVPKGGREEVREVLREEVVELEYKDEDVIMEGKARGGDAKGALGFGSHWRSWNSSGGR